MNTLLPTKTLPPGYALNREVDLSKDRKALIWLNLLSLPLLVGSGWFFWMLAQALRPEALRPVLTLTFGNLLALLVVYAGMMVLHELFHGLFFWLYTREAPVYGLRGAYAYAAAPEWYLPRNRYVWVGLAPLVGISVLGVLLLPWVPPGIEMLLVFVMTLNATGAIGDLWIVMILLNMPEHVLVRDRGDAVAFYS